MNKAKRLIASICAVCLLGTSLIPFAYEAPQARASEPKGNTVQDHMLLPSAGDPYGWPYTQQESATGVRLTYNQASPVNTAHKWRMDGPVSMDGASLTVTRYDSSAIVANTNYEFTVTIAGTGTDNGNCTSGIVLTMLKEGAGGNQLFVRVNNTPIELPGSSNIGGNYRVNNENLYPQGDATPFTFDFEVNDDGSLTVSINGYSFTLSADVVATVDELDLSRACLYVGGGQYALDLEINRFRNGAPSAPNVVQSSNLMPTEADGWYGAATNASYFDNADGVWINQTAPTNNSARHYYRTPVPVDGLTFQMEHYSGYNFNVMLSNTAGSADRSNGLALTVAPADPNGQLYVFVNGKAIDLSDQPEHDPTYPDRINSSKLLNQGTYTFRFDLNEAGDLTITINEYSLTLPAAEVKKLTGLTDMNGTYLYVMGQDAALSYQWNTVVPGTSYTSAAAQNAINLINAIGNVTIDSGDAIAAARDAYDALCVWEKTMAAASYETLTRAETAFEMVTAGETIVTDDMLTPNEEMQAEYQWPVTYENGADGVTVTYSQYVSSAYCHQLKEPVALNGAGIRITYHSGWDYALMLHSTSGRSDRSGAIALTVAPKNSGQINVRLNGAELNLQELGVSDLLAGTTTWINSESLRDTTTYHFTFSLSGDGDLTIKVNDYSFTLPSSVVAQATGLSDLNNVYFYIMPLQDDPNNQPKLSYTLHSVKGGAPFTPESALETIALINAIGNVTIDSGDAITAARNAYDALPTGFRAMVTNYETLTTAELIYEMLSAGETIMTDDMLIPNEEMQAEYQWPVTYENGADGVTVTYSQYLGTEYRHQLKEPVALNGAELRITYHSGWDYALMLHSASGRSDRSGAIALTVAPKNSGQLAVRLNDRDLNLQELGIPDLLAGTTTWINSESLRDTMTYHFTFSLSGDGDLTIKVNDYSFTLPSSVVSQATGLSDFNNVYFYIMPLRDDPNNQPKLSYTLHSVKNGAPFTPESALEVMELITAIGNVEATDECKARIDAARAAYDALPASFRTMVTNYETLTAAEIIYESIVTGSTIITNAMVVPNASTAASWGYKVDYSEDPDGLRINFQQVYNSTMRHKLVTPVALDGTELKLTHYAGWSFFITLSNGADEINRNGNLALQLAPDDPNGQLYVFVNGKAIDLSDQPEHNPTYTDRINSDKLMSQDTFTVSFDLVGDGDLVIRINGYELTLPEETVKDITNLQNPDSVYLYLMPYEEGSTPLSVKLHTIKAGTVFVPESAKAVVEAINAIGTVTTDSGDTIAAARALYDALDPDIQAKVSNYQTLTTAEAVYDNILNAAYNDSHAYTPDAEDVYPSPSMKWGWPLQYLTADDGALRLQYTQTVAPNYTVGLKNITADNMHAKLRVLSPDAYWISFGYRQNRPSYGGCLSFLVNPADGSIGVYTGGGASDVAVLYERLEGIAAAKEYPQVDVRLDRNDDGTYIFVLNGYEYVIGADLLELASDFEAAVEAGGLWLNIAPNNNAPTFDILSIHSGSEACYDDILAEYGTDAVESIDETLALIRQIGTEITAESGDAIKAARASYDALAQELKQYISNYSELETAERLYERLTADTLDLDSQMYPVTEDNIGPNQHWTSEVVDWYPAESGEGVTIEFNNVTVHNLGLHSPEKLSLDGLHIEFANTEMSGYGGHFSFIFASNFQVDRNNEFKPMWLDFNVSETGTVVTLGVRNMNSLTLIDTAYIDADFMADSWDIRFTKQEDGSYLFELAGVVSAVIPAEYIEGAVAGGLNAEELAVTLSGWNFGAQPSHLKLDVVAVHDGSTTCFSAVQQAEVDAAQECIELIDAIGTVTADSGDAIAAARDAYDALTEVAKGLVTNYSVLTAAESSFTKVSSDVDKAAPVIAMIEKLPQTVTLKDRDAVTEALNAYLDLYPRTRKYVTNYDKLAAAVETIEALAPGANLAHDTLNNRTQGQTEDTPQNPSAPQTPGTGECVAAICIAGFLLCVSASVLVTRRKKKNR